MGKNRKNRMPSEAPVAELMEQAGEKFTLNKRRNVASSDSAHQAVFGDIEGHEVVVKPFRSKNGVRKASNELRVTQAVAKAGIPTIDALKVIDLRRQRVALFVSSYIPGLIGAHTLSYESNPDTPQGAAVARAAGSLMQTVGRLHGEKITHGDAQPKNFGFPEDNLAKVVFTPISFDYENGNVYDPRYPVAGQFADGAKQDVQKLAHTLGTRQFGGHDPVSASEVMRDEVLERYLESPAAELLGDLATAQVIDRSMASFEAGRENKAIYNTPLKIKNAA